MMLTPERLWLDRCDKMNLTELKACGNAMAQQLNTQRIMIEAQLVVKGRIRDEASKRGRDASSAVSELDYLIELIDAQQAHIYELEENAQAHKLVMQVGKFMLQAETERADKVEAHLQLANDCQAPLLDRLSELEADNAELLAFEGEIQSILGIGKQPLHALADAVRNRLADLEKDAARYRWLRDSTKCEAPGDFLNIDFDKMDAAIDATMQSTAN